MKKQQTITSSQDYRDLKIRVKEAETHNYNKIILIPCSGKDGWYESAEHSAIFYYYEVCKPLGNEVTFYADTESYFVQYDIGFIRCRDANTIRKRLQKAELYKDECSKNGCIIFTLNKTFTKPHTEQLIKEELARREQNRSIVNITHSDPLLHQTLRELSERVHYSCERQLTRLSAATNGTRMLDIADNLLLYYYNLCETKTSAITIDDWATIGKNINKLMIEIELASEIKLWPRKTCAKLVKLAMRAKEYAAKKYATTLARERKRQNGRTH